MHTRLNNTSIEFFQAGFCHHPEAMVNTKASWKKAVFPAMVALIKHQQMGYVLFDTGYSQRFFDATQKMPGSLYRLATPVTVTESQTMLYQLEQKGISAGEIKAIFISHFHADHIAGLKDFPNARFICSEAGYRAICNKKGLSAVVKGYLKELLPEDFEQRVRFIEQLSANTNIRGFSDFGPCFNVSDDGGLTAISLPGHAKGHYGLLVQHQERKSFLVGDACWTHDAYSNNCRPNKITGLLMDKVSSYHATVDKLRRLYANKKEIEIIPSHCQHSLKERVSQT